MEHTHGKNNTQTVSHLKESFKEVGENIRRETNEKVEHAMSEVRRRSTDVKDAVNGYVQENPAKSLGWALLAGIAIGFLLRK